MTWALHLRYQFQVPYCLEIHRCQHLSAYRQHKSNSILKVCYNRIINCRHRIRFKLTFLHHLNVNHFKVSKIQPQLKVFKVVPH